VIDRSIAPVLSFDFVARVALKTYLTRSGKFALRVSRTRLPRKALIRLIYRRAIHDERLVLKLWPDAGAYKPFSLIILKRSSERSEKIGEWNSIAYAEKRNYDLSHQSGMPHLESRQSAGRSLVYENGCRCG
jgi:hypothetical protein